MLLLFRFRAKLKGREKRQREAKTRVENSCSRRCSSHRNRSSILEVSAKLERNEKRDEKTLSFKEVFYLRDLCWNFKSCSRVFQQRGTSSIGEFPLFITCSSLLRNYGWYVFNKGCVYNQAQEGALIRGRVLI